MNDLETQHCPLAHRQDEPPELPYNAYVCRPCTGTLRGLLTDLPGLMDDVEAAVGRQLRFNTRQGGSRSAETPLPINPAASDTGWTARQTILIYVEEVAAIRGHTVPQTWYSIGHYLADSANWMSRHPSAEEWFDALIYALREARRATDRPADKVYAGTCNGNNVDSDGLLVVCVQQLYAHPGAQTVTCPACGTEHPVSDRRQHMLNKVKGMHLPAADLARAVNGLLGTELATATIRSWRNRGHIEPVGVNTKGQPLYAVADIIQRATRTLEETAS